MAPQPEPRPEKAARMAGHDVMGRVALTEEERKAIQWAEVAASHKYDGTQNVQNADDYQAIRDTLRGLLTRTTTGVVSLTAVEAAVRQYLWSGIDWFEVEPDDIVQGIMDHLTTQRQQEGER